MTGSNPDDRLVAMPCEGANELVLLDVGTGEHLGSIPVGRDTVHATTAAGTTFVATMGDRAVTAVAPAGTVKRVETGVLGPSHFATRQAGRVDVVSVVERSGVAAVDIGPDARIQGVALGPDGDRGYAVDQREARVVTFETEPECTVENTAPVGADPYDLVSLVSPAERVVWATEVPSRPFGAVLLNIVCETVV